MHTIDVEHSVPEVEENPSIRNLRIADEDSIEWSCVIINSCLHSLCTPISATRTVPCCSGLRPASGQNTMDCERHSSSTTTEGQIFEVHAVCHVMYVHARVEWNLSKVNIHKQAILVLGSINTNDVGISVEVCVCKATKDGNVLDIRMSEFFDFVTCLELVQPNVTVVKRGLRISDSDNPTRRGRPWN